MDMDHAEALELIELAAVEPDGLERLMAGDTPESAIVAGHLAGCPACGAELTRIRRSASIARAVIAEQPDPALRDRTLAYVREVGRDRSAATLAGESVVAEIEPEGVDAPEPVRPRRMSGSTSMPRWVRLVGLAAALLIAVGLGFAVAAVRGPAPDLSAEVAVLQHTTEATLRLQAQPDTQRVALTATTAGAGSAGTLLFSPSTGELVMVATGLADLPAGQEYGCWVQAGGERRRIGRMYQGGELQAWAGPVAGLADLPPDAVFGVSLVPAGGGAGEPLLTGGI
jgi:anti-sigma factor RsiW